VTAALLATAQALVGAGRGLLAIDESTSTCNKRFAAAGIAQTAETRRAYRELLITAPGLGTHVSGAILYDETIRQSDRHGMPFVDRLVVAGVIPGIKVDVGAKTLALHPGEKITEGLDGLRARLQDYAKMGARFAKWRAVFGIGDGLPSTACIGANAHALARYAALCQEAGLVPIVEPEVLMTGRHTMQRCGDVTHAVLRAVFDALDAQDVTLEAMILKPNMVLPGLDCPEQEGLEAVANATLACQRRSNSRPAWRSKTRPLMARLMDMRRGPIGPLRMSISSFGSGGGDLAGLGIDELCGGLVLLRPGGTAPASGLPQAVAVAVHGQDADVVGQPIEQGAG
jgi:fructose-bisphosphate aldolase class I